MATLAFGLVHLPFRSFPNWRFALVATVAGFFYGRAYSLSGGIRAAMVTHALVNTTTQNVVPCISGTGEACYMCKNASYWATARKNPKKGTRYLLHFTNSYPIIRNKPGRQLPPKRD